MPATIEDLRSVYKALTAKDQETAASLGQGYHRYGSWTAKQMALVEMLVARGRNTRTKPLHFDLAGLHTLFDQASAAGKQFPKLLGQIGNVQIKLYRAGEKSRTPGAINVVERLRHEHGNGAYYGKVLPSGEWKQGQVMLPGLVEFLDELAHDPAGVASAFGQATGTCMFCAKELTDPRSVEVGYGPKCASTHNLPWGEK